MNDNDDFDISPARHSETFTRRDWQLTAVWAVIGILMALVMVGLAIVLWP